MSILERQLLRKRGLPPTGMSEMSQHTSRNRRDFSPLTWDSYFDEMKDIQVGDDIFRVYLSGYSQSDANSSNDDSNPTLVLLHGGGYSALTWAPFTKCITEMCKCRIMAIDLRGHGNTITSNDYDLSVTTLVNDIGAVIESVNQDLSTTKLILIGHSMGGALAVHCSTLLDKLAVNIVGIVVIDVVEGTALDALTYMQSFLRGRPSQFRTLESAIEWCIKSGQTKNIESARVSMPGQLRNQITNQVATCGLNKNQDDGDNQDEHENDDLETASKSLALDTLKEEEIEDNKNNEEKDANKNDDNDDVYKKPFDPPPGFTWRIDLSKTEQHWTGWFTNLSSLFLNCKAGAKLLILAGIDRLDNTLMIGQMQGKFQMQVLPKCGHTVHEDVPDKVASVISGFLIRNKFTTELSSNFERHFPSC